MALRRPAVYRRNEIIFQDFLDYDDGSLQFRYILGKYDGEPYETVAETFDYPFPEEKGGSVVSRIDYTVEGSLITIDNWEINWRDEWPLRLSIQFLTNCLFKQSDGFVVRVNKDAYSFFVSEDFIPLTNDEFDYLVSS